MMVRVDNVPMGLTENLAGPVRGLADDRFRL